MANSRSRRRAGLTPADEIAATQVACDMVAGNRKFVRAIAHAAGAPVYQITGPMVDAIASILLREPVDDGSNVDPYKNAGWIADACRRALRPRWPTCDPTSLDVHDGSFRSMDLDTAVLYDAPTVADAAAAARRIAAKARRFIDCGSDHSKKGHRAKERAARGVEAGQLWFTGLTWRKPGANDDESRDWMQSTGEGARHG